MDGAPQKFFESLTGVCGLRAHVCIFSGTKSVIFNGFVFLIVLKVLSF